MGFSIFFVLAPLFCGYFKVAEAEWTRRWLFLAPHCGRKKRLRSNTCEHERHDNANSELSFTVVQSAVEKAGGDFMARHVHHF